MSWGTLGQSWVQLVGKDENTELDNRRNQKEEAWSETAGKYLEKDQTQKKIHKDEPRCQRCLQMYF